MGALSGGADDANHDMASRDTSLQSRLFSTIKRS